MVSILFFDSDCLICNSYIKFVFEHDANKCINFCGLDSITSKKYDIDILSQSMIFIDGENKYYKSEAFIKILEKIEFNRFAIYILKMIPIALRDFMYYIISRNRNIISSYFPNKSCEINSEIKKRILS